MTLQKRERWALVVLAVATVAMIVLRFTLAEGPAPVVAATASVPIAAKRLAQVRQLAAALPSRERTLKTASAALAEREKGMLQADTPAQAQAQLLQVVRRMAAAQSPPLEVRSSELGQVRPLGADYGEVSVPVSFECHIEQLLNLLADVTSQPELLATSELRISAANAKDKTINVRLTLSGVVPRRLVPEKRGPGLL